MFVRDDSGGGTDSSEAREGVAGAAGISGASFGNSQHVSHGLECPGCALYKNEGYKL